MHIEKQAFSIPEFCAAYSVGRAKLYRMMKAGEGPRIMKVGRKTIISKEAADEWRRNIEAKTQANAKEGAK